MNFKLASIEGRARIFKFQGMNFFYLILGPVYLFIKGYFVLLIRSIILYGIITAVFYFGKYGINGNEGFLNQFANNQFFVDMNINEYIIDISYIILMFLLHFFLATRVNIRAIKYFIRNKGYIPYDTEDADKLYMTRITKSKLMTLAQIRRED